MGSPLEIFAGLLDRSVHEIVSATIARRLGVGCRIVQRRAAGLIDSLGVQSRFQVDAQAALTSTRAAGPTAGGASWAAAE